MHIENVIQYEFLDIREYYIQVESTSNESDLWRQETLQLSERNIRKRPLGHVHLTKIQISLRIRAV